MYPTLYDMDRYLPYFNSNIKSLSQESINGIINTSAVDIKNRPSEVVQVYAQIKNNYGRHMERNSDAIQNQITHLDRYLYMQIPSPITITAFKQLFYSKYCPFDLKPHSPKNCKRCKSVSLHDIGDDQFRLHFFKINGPPSTPLPSYKLLSFDHLFKPKN